MPAAPQTPPSGGRAGVDDNSLFLYFENTIRYSFCPLHLWLSPNATSATNFTTEQMRYLPGPADPQQKFPTNRRKTKINEKYSFLVGPNVSL